MTLPKILLAGRDAGLLKLVQQFAEQLFSADCITDLADLASSVSPDLIILDSTVAHNNVCDFLEWAKARNIETPIITAGDDCAIASKNIIAMGAHDYLRGESDYCRLGKIIAKIKRIENGSNEFFSDHCPAGVEIVGKSAASNRTLQMINVVAKSNCNPILIVGETGTGKELAAQAIHQVRHGSGKPFVEVNCAALTANLLESELFGHAKGSFTSAEKEKTGLLELAGEGSIFLDEISEMPIDLQAKLLRVIQEKNFRKVGGIKTLECKATIITSSNRNLFKDVEENKFRRDLYYRLSVCPITLSPLRTPDRHEDIETLASFFLQTSTICPDKQGQIKGFTALAMDAIRKHSWPGNVRELKNVIDRAVLLENSDKVGLSNLMLNPESVIDEARANVSKAIEDFSLESAEREMIARALDAAGWQKTKAASMLGITRATLYAKVKQHNLSPAGQIENCSNNKSTTTV